MTGPDDHLIKADLPLGLNPAGSNPVLAEEWGRFADNIVYFSRALRRAGIPTNSSDSIDAIRIIPLIGLASRTDFYWSLHSIFVRRRSDHPVFDEIFQRFWRGRNLLDKMLELLSPAVEGQERRKEKPAGSLRAAAALHAMPAGQAAPTRTEIEVDARFSFSEREKLAEKDFAQMSAEEIAKARLAMRKLILPLDKVPHRRTAPSKNGRIDLRRMLRSSMRIGGGFVELRHRDRVWHRPPLVVLCDISGSMAQYSRILVHFCHALINERRNVHAFVFGTRLTNITRMLQMRDPDEALAACGSQVMDWSGGTRIAQSLHAFNYKWSRRVLAGGAIVLLVSDGLEREAIDDLTNEMDRLHRSCRRLIWLNPLLRYDGFSAKARGIRAMLPHVDEFRAVHNLHAVGELCSALSGKSARPRADIRTHLDYLKD